jgi:hypothetical protein
VVRDYLRLTGAAALEHRPCFTGVFAGQPQRWGSGNTADSPEAPDEFDPATESDEDEDDLIRELFSSLADPVEPVDPEAVG